MGLPDTLSRQHYEVVFDEVLEEARHLGVIVKSQDMKQAEKKQFYESEGVVDPNDDSGENPLSRIYIENQVLPSLATLTRGRAAATGGEVAGTQ